MVFDRALTNTQIRCDILAGMTGKNEIHNLALSRRQARDLACSRLLPSDQFVCIPRLLERAFDAVQQVMSADRLGDEIGSAPFHGLNRYLYVAIARHHDCRESVARLMESGQQFQSAHPGQVGVHQEAGLAI